MCVSRELQTYATPSPEELDQQTISSTNPQDPGCVINNDVAELLERFHKRKNNTDTGRTSLLSPVTHIVAAKKDIRSSLPLGKRAKSLSTVSTAEPADTMAAAASQQQFTESDSPTALTPLQVPEVSRVDVDDPSDAESTSGSHGVRSTPPSSLAAPTLSKFNSIAYDSDERKCLAEGLSWLDLAGASEPIIPEHAPVSNVALDLAVACGSVVPRGDEADICTHIFQEVNGNCSSEDDLEEPVVESATVVRLQPIRSAPSNTPTAHPQARQNVAAQSSSTTPSTVPSPNVMGQHSAQSSAATPALKPDALDMLNESMTRLSSWADEDEEEETEEDFILAATPRQVEECEQGTEERSVPAASPQQIEDASDVPESLSFLPLYRHRGLPDQCRFFVGDNEQADEILRRAGVQLVEMQISKRRTDDQDSRDAWWQRVTPRFPGLSGLPADLDDAVTDAEPAVSNSTMASLLPDLSAQYEDESAAGEVHVPADRVEDDDLLEDLYGNDTHANGSSAEPKDLSLVCITAPAPSSEAATPPAMVIEDVANSSMIPGLALRLATKGLDREEDSAVAEQELGIDLQEDVITLPDDCAADDGNSANDKTIEWSGDLQDFEVDSGYTSATSRRSSVESDRTESDRDSDFAGDDAELHEKLTAPRPWNKTPEWEVDRTNGDVYHNGIWDAGMCVMFPGNAINPGQSARDRARQIRMVFKTPYGQAGTWNGRPLMMEDVPKHIEGLKELHQLWMALQQKPQEVGWSLQTKQEIRKSSRVSDTEVLRQDPKGTADGTESAQRKQIKYLVLAGDVAEEENNTDEPVAEPSSSLLGGLATAAKFVWRMVFENPVLPF